MCSDKKNRVAEKIVVIVIKSGDIGRFDTRHCSIDRLGVVM